MTPTLVAIVVAYLLGSVVGSLVLGRARGVDIRTQGSGNAGGTNALRTQGKGFAALVMLIDVGKGVVAAGPLAVAAARWGGDPDVLRFACGAAAVVGHVWPVFFGFRGGKGAATLVGVVGAAAPVALLVLLGVFAAVLVASGYVGLSTILATASLAAWAAAVVPGGLASPFGVFAIGMTAFIVYTHRSNLLRMRAGNENRFERVMLFRRRA